jgi:uncharacterized Fe-S cluster protein YjdI
MTEKRYTNDEITVIWKPELCVHSGVCVKNSPEVFRPKEKPWVKIEAETSDKIMQTVEKCPSGALSYHIENEIVDPPNHSQEVERNAKVELMKNGPLIVYGSVEIKDSDGSLKTSGNETTAFCRCGASKKKPFCDGSHGEVKFRG